MYLDAVQWQLHVDDLRLRWAEERRVKIVTYESLVQEPNVVVREVCEFVEEPFVESMLTERSWSSVTMREYGSYSSGEETWVRNHLASTIAPISAASVDKWKASLMAWEVRCIEKACASGMQWLEYKKAYAEVSLPEKLRGHVCWFWSGTCRKLFSRNHHSELGHRMTMGK
jgi:hypothetical protein